MKRHLMIGRLMRRWHTQIGIFAAAFFVFLAATGLLLNHGDLIDLDKVDLKTPWLMSWYGLETILPANGFRDGDKITAFSDDVWVVAERAVKPGHGKVVGVVSLDDVVWVASTGELSLYQNDGQLIDRIEMESLPALPIRRIGAMADLIVIDTAQGSFGSTDGINWKKVAAAGSIAWSQAEALSSAEQNGIRSFFAPSLPALRIISDIHSGHIWGRYGMLATDSLAAALLILVASGAWIYFRGNRLRRAPERVVHVQQHGKQKQRAHLVRSAKRHRHGVEQGRNPER